jgi:hypothetical protein
MVDPSGSIKPPILFLSTMTQSISQVKLEKKRRIIETCLELKVAFYQELRASAKQSVADLAEPGELDQQSQAGSTREESWGELESGSIQLDALAREIEILEGLLTEKVYSQVQLGSVVKTDKIYFLVAVSQPVFQVESEAYFGVSTQSPLLQFSQGLIQGDSFTVANRTYLIREVF